MGFFGRFSGKKYLATHEQLLAWEVKKIACELGVNESEVSFVVHKTDYGTETEFFINNKPVDEFQKEQDPSPGGSLRRGCRPRGSSGRGGA